MAEFALPKMSKVQEERYHAAKLGAKKVRRFRVYRWDPEIGGNPRMDTFGVDVSNTSMVLDVPLKIENEIDPTLTLRRSCHEGVCGSCSMTINGESQLACITALDRLAEGVVNIYPLAHMPVVKGLVPDLTRCYAQYASIKPWLQTQSSRGDPEPAVAGRSRQAESLVRTHPVRLLRRWLPPVGGGIRIGSWAVGIAGGVSLDQRLT